MRLSLATIALFLSLTAPTQVAFGQQTTCSCQESCHVSCARGCTVLCDSLKTCKVSCGVDVLDERITLKLSNQRGQQIASALSDQTHTKIAFAPSRRYAQMRYDLDIQNDDIWNVLTFLDKFGAVKVRGMDFSSLRELHKMKSQLTAPRSPFGTHVRVVGASVAKRGWRTTKVRA